MSATKMIRIVQTVHVDHNATLERSWYDEVERTIEREIGADGTVLRETVLDERTLRDGLDLEEETIATDEDTLADEIVEEEFEEDDEDGKVY